MKKLNEDTLTEQPTLEWLKGLGYDIEFGPDLAPGGAYQERDTYQEVVLVPRLRRSIKRLNARVPDVVIEGAVRSLITVRDQSPIFANKEVYEMITRGVKVEYRNSDGESAIEQVRIIDFDDPLNNEFLAVNQYAVQGVERVRRPDVVVFVNGLPLVVFELKSPTSDTGTVASAIDQLATYKQDIPALFAYNQTLIASDLLRAVHGTVSSSHEWFAEWKYIEDEGEKQPANLETLIKGIFDKERFLDIVQNFIVFEADSEKDATTYIKKMCKYHQYYGVVRSIASTKTAMRPRGGRKVGVFWHTQGSGKTLSMVFYVNKLRHLAEAKSPTIVFLTDRKDLDDQIYKTFKRSGYAAIAKKMENIADLKDKLRNPGAEIIFTTIQKFDTKQELLSENENIILISDEAHRSQYAKFAANARDALPKASFMGITGTPISFSDRDTRLVFGDFVSVYRIDQAVDDHATVPLYYEGRLVPLMIDNPALEEEYDALVKEGLDEDDEDKLKRKAARLEGAIGAPERLDKIAQDVVAHYNNRGIEGKAMVVTLSRKIAVELYKKIREMPDAPEAAVVVSNIEEFKDEVQDELSPKELEKRFKKANDPLKLAIVCDMWLTGFDVPPLHTMYIDKPLKGHTLMQAIARANRVYKDKPAGLIVDYIGVAENLKKALSLYSTDVKNPAVFPLEKAIVLMHEKHALVSDYFAQVDSWQKWTKLSGTALADLFQAGVSAVLGEEDRIDEERKVEYVQEVTKLEKIHALVMPHKEASAIRDDVAFFQAIRNAMYKRTVTPPPQGGEKDTESAIKELIEKSISAEGVIDIFTVQGKEKPEISIFDEKFLEEIKQLRFKNLAIEVLRKLLKDQLKLRVRTNKTRYESLLQLLEELIEQYENNIIASSKVIERLLELARDIKLQDTVGLELGLSEEELAFYDALSMGKKEMNGNDALKKVVKDLVSIIRRDVSIDWTSNDVVKSRIRANVRLLLLRNGYNVEDTERLVETVFDQASVLYRDIVMM